MKLAGQNLYDEIFRHFVEKMQGAFLLATDDHLFVKIFKSCFKYLNVGTDSISQISDTGKTLRQVAELGRRYQRLVVVVEAQVQGKSTLHLFSQVKELCPGRCNVVCITAEVSRDNIIHMQEMGADNVIVKPVTMNNVIQKIALTIRPNTKISKLVDGCKKLIEEDKLFEAMQVVDMIFQEKPDSTIGHMLRGDIHRKHREFKNAENAYLRASHHSRLYLEPLKRLAALYQDVNDPASRLKYLKRLDELAPLNHDRKIEIGAVCLEMNNAQEAKAFFDEAVKLVKKQNDELMSGTLMEIGRKLQEKSPAAGLDYMAQAIALKEEYLSQDDIWMFNEIGLGYRRNGQTEKAVEYYEKALNIVKGDGAIYYNIGMAHAESGNPAMAVRNFERAIETTPDILGHSPQIPYNIAAMYQKAGRRGEAAHYYGLCLAQDPDFKDARAKAQALAGE